MSGRFAPVTASLFARNIDAVASATLLSLPTAAIAESTHPVAKPLPRQTTRRPPPDTPRPHTVRVALSDAEFEAFGLAAVKRSATRQQLLREAINRYLDTLARDFGRTCACLAQGSGVECCGRCPTP
jgi:hypothetical protein